MVYVFFIYPLCAAYVNIKCGTRVRYQWYVFIRHSAPQTHLSKVQLLTLLKCWYHLIAVVHNSKVYKTPQNYRRQNSDMKQRQY